MKSRTNQTLRRWVKHAPDSSHFHDRDRFFDLIDTLIEEENGEWDEEEFSRLIQEFCPEWTPERVTRFLDRWTPRIELIIEYTLRPIRQKAAGI